MTVGIYMVSKLRIGHPMWKLSLQGTVKVWGVSQVCRFCNVHFELATEKHVVWCTFVPTSGFSWALLVVGCGLWT